MKTHLATLCSVLLTSAANLQAADLVLMSKDTPPLPIILAEDDRRGAAAETSSSERCQTVEYRSVGPIKAFESLIPMLAKVFTGELRGRALAAELARLARYAAQERRTRPRLDALVIGLLS